MKRILALMLTVLIMLACTACAPDSGDTEGESTTAHTHSHTNEETTSITAETSALSSGETTTEASTAQSQSQTDADTDSTDKNSNTQEGPTAISQGKINSNTYKSEFSDLKFTKPDDWRYLSMEALADKTDVRVEELDEKVFSNTADRVAAVYDMYAYDDSTGISVVIYYENMHVTSGSAMTAENYLQMLKGGFENTEGTQLIKESTVSLSSKTYLKAVFETESGGTAAQKIYYLRQMGKFMNIVLVTVPEGADTPATEKMFS